MTFRVSNGNTNLPTYLHISFLILLFIVLKPDTNWNQEWLLIQRLLYLDNIDLGSFYKVFSFYQSFVFENSEWNKRYEHIPKDCSEDSF